MFGKMLFVAAVTAATAVSAFQVVPVPVRPLVDPYGRSTGAAEGNALSIGRRRRCAVIVYSSTEDPAQPSTADEKESDGNEASNADIRTELKPLGDAGVGDENDAERRGLRKRVRDKVRNRVARLAKGATKARAIAEVLTDAAVGSAEIVEDVMPEAVSGRLRRVRKFASGTLADPLELEDQAKIEGEAAEALDAIQLAKTTVADAFAAADSVITVAERELERARAELNAAKADASKGLATAELAAADAAAKARRATARATSAVTGVLAAEEKVGAASAAEPGVVVANLTTPTITIEEADIASLAYEDVDYHLTEMAPPFIGEDQCLVPGEAVVRVEKAPENSRRIFAGIDIPNASVDDVWKVLTDYENLQQVVPNLVVNEVVELFDGNDQAAFELDPALSDEVQCKKLSEQMKGAVLKQVGGAKVVGINFSARTTLEVREWPGGMPDFAHFSDEIFEGKSRSIRARDNKKKKLKRYRFPRPFAMSTLPTRDISMQSIEKDDGEFRMYQGVWRMQPLPGCAPPGSSAMRLTYAVEVSPRPYLPVALVEGRIAQDLCANLAAIRDFVSVPTPVSP